MSRMSRCVSFGAVILFIFKADFANAADSRLRLNFEALKFRIVTERQIEVIKTLRETLQQCEMIFSAQVRSEVEKNGLNPEKVYKDMLALKSSGEIFEWYQAFLSKNDTLREILEKTFVRTDSGSLGSDKKIAAFRLGTTDFFIRWFWLYPSKEGIELVAQEEMSQAVAD